MRATEEMPLDLDPMADHFALTMLANRSHCLDRALETIECMPRSSRFDDEGLVVFVAADFAICHRIPPLPRCCISVEGLICGPPKRARQAAPDCGLEISATVFDTFSGLSLSARSACATIPIQRPSPSITGIRRI